MKRMLIAVVAFSCGMLATTSTARKTYTLNELESMKKAGTLTGNERFAIVHGKDAGSFTGGRTEISTLVPSDGNQREDISDLIAYDAIGNTRYLITMAREYYGNPEFWPYIYEENKDRFGHPDRITPGTMVLVPRLSKYGVDPKNPADVEKAKQLGRAIYARYGKNL